MCIKLITIKTRNFAKLRKFYRMFFTPGGFLDDDLIHFSSACPGVAAEYFLEQVGPDESAGVRDGGYVILFTTDLRRLVMRLVKQFISVEICEHDGKLAALIADPDRNPVLFTSV